MAMPARAKSGPRLTLRNGSRRRSSVLGDVSLDRGIKDGHPVCLSGCCGRGNLCWRSVSPKVQANRARSSGSTHSAWTYATPKNMREPLSSSGNAISKETKSSSYSRKADQDPWKRQVSCVAGQARSLPTCASLRSGLACPDLDVWQVIGAALLRRANRPTFGSACRAAIATRMHSTQFPSVSARALVRGARDGTRVMRRDPARLRHSYVPLAGVRGAHRSSLAPLPDAP